MSNKKQQSLARFFGGITPPTGSNSTSPKKQQSLTRFFGSSSNNSSPKKATTEAKQKREATPPKSPPRETILIKAISECYGRETSKIKADYKSTGDLGLIAQKSRSLQPTMFKTAPLDVDTVFDNSLKIAKSTGKESQSKKISIIKQC
ncbi:DNA ligase N terminus family protein [Candida albicans]|uniref:DNA ligase N terminus family protein n=1 Tax=Candida albicans TaxID=5476 RepID=A0A8H6C4L8_CANAX|nr:DNA ligase N terminus family protein [Candida albicans]